MQLPGRCQNCATDLDVISCENCSLSVCKKCTSICTVCNICYCIWCDDDICTDIEMIKYVSVKDGICSITREKPIGIPSELVIFKYRVCKYHS